MPNVEQHLMDWETLEVFVSHLPNEQREPFTDLIARLRESEDEDKLESATLLRGLGQKKKRFELQCTALLRLFFKVMQTSHAHGIEVLNPHFRELIRLNDEFEAPSPTLEEIRAELDAEVKETINER